MTPDARPDAAAGTLIEQPYHFAALLIMLTTFIVGVFYCLDALHGERRDRSILFWKSLPVSDLTTVLSKASIPLVVLPLVTFAVTVAAHWIMLLLSSAVLLGSGMSVAALWTQCRCSRCRLMLLYHLVAVHALWYAPFYGWLLLVSAGRGARRFCGPRCRCSRSASWRRSRSTPRISPPCWEPHRRRPEGGAVTAGSMSMDAADHSPRVNS